MSEERKAEEEEAEEEVERKLGFIMGEAIILTPICKLIEFERETRRERDPNPGPTTTIPLI